MARPKNADPDSPDYVPNITEPRGWEYDASKETKKTRELTLDEAIAEYGDLPTVQKWQEDPTRFLQRATGETTQNYRQQIQQINEELPFKQAQRDAIWDFGTQKKQADQDWQKEIETFQSDLEALGQDTPELVQDAKNIARLAIRMLETEGEDETSQETRTQGAYILKEYEDLLRPHAGDNWYNDNKSKMDQYYSEPNWLQKAGASTLEGAMGWLSQSGIAAASALGGLEAALDTGDEVSAWTGLKHAYQQGASALDYTRLLPGGMSLSEEAKALTGDYEAGATYIVDNQGNRYEMDRDASGDLNLREALGMDPNVGGPGVDISLVDILSLGGIPLAEKLVGKELNLEGQELDLSQVFNMPKGWKMGTGFLTEDRRLDTLGVFDTVGLAAIDPLNWISLGSGTKVKAALSTLQKSSDDLARMAGRGLSRGDFAAKGITPEMRAAARQTWAETYLKTIENMTPRQLVRAGWRELDVKDARRLLGREIKDLDKLKNELLTRRLDAIEKAVERGAMPGIRIAGKTVVPMARLYRGLRLFETAKWVQRARGWEALGSAEEVMEFMARWEPGTEVPDSMWNKIESFSKLGEELGKDPNPYLKLEELVAAAPDPQAALANIKAFAEDVYKIDTSQWKLREPAEWRSGSSYQDARTGANRTEAWPEMQPALFDDEFRQAEFIEGAERIPKEGATPEEIAKWKGIETGEGRPVQDDFAAGRAGSGRILDEEILAFNRGEGGRFSGGKSPDAPGGQRERAVGRVLGEPEQLSFGDIDATWARGDGTRKVLDDVIESELGEQAMERIAKNLDMVTDPLKWVREVTKKSVFQHARASERAGWKLMDRVFRAFTPRAGTYSTPGLGGEVARQVDDEIASAQGLRRLFEDDMAMMDYSESTGASGLARAADQEAEAVKKAIKDSALPMDWDGKDVQEFVGRALADPDSLPSRIRSLENAGAQATADLIAVLDDVRARNFKLLGLSEAEIAPLLARPGYMPRVRTRKAQEAAREAANSGDKDLQEAFAKLGLLTEEPDGTFIPAGPGGALDQGGFLSERTWEKDVEDIFELNETARQVWKDAGFADPDWQLYEDDAVMTWVLRSRAAHEGYATVNMFNGLAKLTDDEGRQLAYIARSGASRKEAADNILATELTMKAEAKGARFKEHAFPGGGKVWIREEIYDDLLNTNRLSFRETTHSAVKDGLNAWNDAWGAYATVPLVDFSFHARNATGNLHLMILAGMKDPRYINRAKDLQIDLSRVRSLMRSKQLTFNDAVEELGLDAKTVNYLREGRLHNMDTGGQTGDFFRRGRKDEGETIIERSAGGKSLKDRLLRDNKVINTGRKFGETVENNARWALFMDGMDQGMGADQAARRVRKFLFDYSDLTSFEAENLRMLSRFYTFTRKNTALQAEMALTQPARIMNAERITRAYVDALMGEEGVETDEGFIGNNRFVPDWAADTLRLYQRRGAMAGVDTPFQAAAEVADSLRAIGSMPPAYINIARARDDAERDRAKDLFADKMRKALQLTSGGPVELVNTIFELQTNTSMFTGGPLFNEDTKWYDYVTTITDIVAPVGSKGTRLYENTVGGEKELQLQLLNSILGITTLELDDPEKARDALDGMFYVLKLNLDAQAREQREVGGMPDWKDMEDDGRVSLRNNVLDYLLIKSMDPEFDWDNLDEETMTYLQREVSTEFLRALGMDIPKAERAAWDEQRKIQQINEAMSAMAAMGIEVDKAMEMDYIKLTSGATIAGTTGLNIEPFYTRNKYKEGPAADRDYSQEAYDIYSSLGAYYGFTVADMQEMSPLLPDLTREINLQREAGWSEAETQNWLIEDMARKKQVFLFGEDFVDKWRYDRYTAEDAAKDAKRASKLESEFFIYWQTFIGGTPPENALDQWIAHNMMTNKEERALGFEPIRTPSQKDARTDDEKWEDSFAKWDAVQGRDELDFFIPQE